MDLHACGQGTVRQEVIESGVDQDLCAGLSRKSSALGYLLHPGGRGLDMRAIAVTYVQAKPGIIRHDIRGQASTLVDVMKPRGRLNMFAHQIDAMGAEFCCMHSAPSKPGTPSSMCA